MLIRKRRSKECKSEKKQLTVNITLDENVEYIRQIFLNDDTLIVRYFSNRQNPEVRGCVLHIDGMVNKEMITENIIQPILQNAMQEQGAELIEAVRRRVLTSSDIEQKTDMVDLVNGIIEGKTVLFFDQAPAALLINTQEVKSRDITEPESEKILLGPREGFTEPLMINLSLIRRKLETPDLKFFFMKIGVQSQTKVCICYLDGIANPSILEELKKRLSGINIDGLIASTYLVELIKDSPLSPFKTIGNTERPDVVAAKLLEGRIAVMVDGSPAALTLPFLFIEYFQSNEDYYTGFYYGSINRLLRMISFIITVSVPAVFVALLTYHQEMVPTPLLLSISAARNGVPFPTIIETLIMLMVFEIMRETGVRMPTTIGQALSIVGALVLGTASVDARIVSAPVVIVVAISGITGLMIPKIKGASVLFRFLLLLPSAFMGLYGFVFAITCILLHLCGIRSFGVPYLLELTSLKIEDWKDTAIKAPKWYLDKRSEFISGMNRIRQRTNGGGTTGR